MLVDLVDYLAPLAEASLVELARDISSSGRKLVVRLHGAWRSQPSDFHDRQGPDLRAVWSVADAVLVASRSHLVRLASSGDLDAQRTRLAPVGFSGAEPTASACPELGARTRLLIAGEAHREALAPVLGMLQEADPSKATFQVISAAMPLRKALGSARAVLIPATEAFGDRSLVDAVLRAGVSVIASTGASAIDAPLPPGLTVVSGNGSSQAWREALESGLASAAQPSARCLEEIHARQHEILSSIHASDGGSQDSGSHFEREAAA